MKNIYTLNWSHFIQIKDFKYQLPKVRGVYVWGFNLNNNFTPYYVGKAKDIHKRIQEHITGLLSGRYTIYHKECLHDISIHKKGKITNTGKLYEPKWPENYFTFLNNRSSLQEHIDYMVKTFTFMYAEAPIESIDDKLLGLYERECIFKIGKDKLGNIRGARKTLIDITHINFNF